MHAVRNIFDTLTFSPHFDLTSRQISLLARLATAAAPVPVRKAASDLKVSKPVISRAANTLQACGLLQRQPGVEDKRDMFLCATAQGRGLVARLAAAAGQGMAE